MASVIIADDHPLLLVGAQTVIAEAGHTVIASVGTGEAALAIKGGEVLLVDTTMPGGAGIDVLRALRERGDRRPVVLMTAGVDNNVLRTALALGVNGIFLKSSPPAQLVSCLEAVIGGQRWVDPGLVDQAITAETAPADNALGNLSQRDQAIVRLVVGGLRNRDIGERLGMTEGNVKVTLHRIYERLGVTNRVELAMLARDAMDQMAAAAE